MFAVKFFSANKNKWHISDIGFYLHVQNTNFQAFTRKFVNRLTLATILHRQLI